MPVSKPFKRTARPQAGGGYHDQCGYISHPRYATAPEHYIRAFLVLQKDLLGLFDFIEPADGNSLCYSFRIHELHTRACIEVEANFKAILYENNYPTGSRDQTMMDYRKLEPTHHLSSYEVRLPIWRGSDSARKPFAAWKGTGGLPWYQAYNSTKHSRHDNFEQSNFQNLIDAMCGLVVILAAQFWTIDFGPTGYVGKSSLLKGYEIGIGEYFELKFPNDWSANDAYSFNWHQLSTADPNPFQTLIF